MKVQRGRRLREQGDRTALIFRAARVGEVDEVLVETRTASGYGAGAGVLLTDDHAVLGVDAERPVERFRTGYTRDYSPVRLEGFPDDLPDAVVVSVLLESHDTATGVLRAVPVESTYDISGPLRGPRR